jgi:hypothetical protein
MRQCGVGDRPALSTAFERAAEGRGSLWELRQLNCLEGMVQTLDRQPQEPGRTRLRPQMASAAGAATPN